LEQVPVRCCSKEQESIIQLRSGDRILSKGGRWSIDFFARPKTPNISPSFSDKDCYDIDGQSQPLEQSDCSRTDNTTDSLPPTLSPGGLHYLLQLDEPNRAITWARYVYRPKDNEAVLQYSLWKHYKSTFETYGSLIPPLTMLNAVKYAFPSATLEKEFGESKYVMKGIQLREVQAETSSMAEHDSAEVTASPRLQEIRFDIELVSPDILKGAGPPTWRIVEDSKAKLSFNEDEVVGAYEEGKNLEAIAIEQQPPVSSDTATLVPHAVDGIPWLPGNEMLLGEVGKTHCELLESSTRGQSIASESRSDRQEAGAFSHSSPIFYSHMASTMAMFVSSRVESNKTGSLEHVTEVDTVLRQGEEHTNSTIHTEFRDQNRIQERQHNNDH
jgi:hypothetical protein